MSKVTVAIPTYNRRDYLKQSIESVLAQTFSDFEILVFDNHSDYNVADFLDGFNDPRIKLVGSEENLGGFGNFCRIYLYKFASPYLVIFHDDDAMHPQMLEREFGVLEKNPSAVFAASDLNFIHDHKSINKFSKLGKQRPPFICRTAGGLVRLFMKDFDLCFDSVMYKTSALLDSAAVEQFGKWGDRSYLVNLAKKGPVVVLKEKLVNYRIHPKQDSQDSSAGFGQIELLAKFFLFYKENLPRPLSFWDKWLFYSYTTNSLVLFPSSFVKNFRDYWNIIKICRQEGLFYFRYINIRGIYYFYKALKRISANSVKGHP